MKTSKINKATAKLGELNSQSRMTLLKLCAIVVLFATSSRANSQTFVDSGACPFECCKYGTWTALEPVAAFITQERTDSVVCKILAGESFNAIGGEVHVKPVNFVFETKAEKFNSGDTISLLSYLGEGVFRTKTKSGQSISVELDFSPYEIPKNGKVSKLGRLLEFYTFQWWAKIECQNGKRAWIDARQNISGKDGCEK